MPGFDGKGPMGMGAMTGGARGLCNPVYRESANTGFGPGAGRGGGRGRGYRHMYWATGQPGWMRPANAGFRAMPYDAAQAGDREIDVLKNQTKALEAQLAALNSRLQELES
ncbi:MAG: DUF5320 domain-containing protein [Deltaproteobacteria bacterium]|nr:DUF5320 domain-containing protein [Deltaproteobacteria bacterium]